MKKNISTAKKIIRAALAACALCLSAFVIWLYGSHSPSEKTYTSDRQFSYWLEEYNYNVILNKVLDSTIYKTRYKAIVFDEITGRRLLSGYVGEMTSTDQGPGFVEELPSLSLIEGGRFWFRFKKPGYSHELPRQRDRQAAEREWKRQEAIRDSIWNKKLRLRAIADSIRWERECAEVRQLFREQQAESPIPTEDVAWLEPVIRPWLDFYGIDLSQALLAGVSEGGCFNCQDSENNPYYWEFGHKDDSPSLVQMSYSPDRRRYVDMDILVEKLDGVWHDTGMYDVDQSVWLVDRRLKTKNMLVYNGSSVRVEDIFWKGNDVFVMVGSSHYNVLLFQIDVYDIPGRTHRKYEALSEYDTKMWHTIFGSYRDKVYLPSRGIVPYELNTAQPPL